MKRGRTAPQRNEPPVRGKPATAQPCASYKGSLTNSGKRGTVQDEQRSGGIINPNEVVGALTKPKKGGGGGGGRGSRRNKSVFEQEEEKEKIPKKH